MPLGSGLRWARVPTGVLQSRSPLCDVVGGESPCCATPEAFARAALRQREKRGWEERVRRTGGGERGIREICFVFILPRPPPIDGRACVNLAAEEEDYSDEDRVAHRPEFGWDAGRQAGRLENRSLLSLPPSPSLSYSPWKKRRWESGRFAGVSSCYNAVGDDLFSS